MRTILGIVALTLMLVVASVASSWAEPSVGPICLRTPLEDLRDLEIFALPMGGTPVSQLLLSAHIAGTTISLSGSAIIRETPDGPEARFSLLTASTSVGAGLTFSSQMNLQTGAGTGSCSVIDRKEPGVPPACGTATPLTYTLISCP